MKKVFLGGTCNDSTWRPTLKNMLTIDYFDPVVDDWNEEAQLEEERQKVVCDVHLYVITPRMSGVYSIAEAVDSAWQSWISKDTDAPKETVFCILKEDAGSSFNEGQMKSLKAVERLVEARGGHSFESLKDTADFLNNL